MSTCDSIGSFSIAASTRCGTDRTPSTAESFDCWHNFWRTALIAGHDTGAFLLDCTYRLFQLFDGKCLAHRWNSLWFAWGPVGRSSSAVRSLSACCSAPCGSCPWSGRVWNTKFVRKSYNSYENNFKFPAWFECFLKLSFAVWRHLVGFRWTVFWLFYRIFDISERKNT